MARTAREKASVHATRFYYCSCGATPHGNGGQYQHRKMHERRKDGHHGITPDAWRGQFRPHAEFGRRLAAARTQLNWARWMVVQFLDEHHGVVVTEDDVRIAEAGGYASDSLLGTALSKMLETA